MENDIKIEKTNLPGGIIEAIVVELAIGLITDEKIAKKYNVSADTITRYKKLFAERIGAIKKEIRESVASETKTWAGKLTKDMQELSETLVKEAFLKIKREKASLSQIIISIATLIDKVQLLTGGVTSRTETVKMTSKEDVLNLLTGDKQENKKLIEKSISFESAKNKEKDENLDRKLKITENEIKNILKNQCDLIN